MHIEIVTDTYAPDVNGAAKSLGYLVDSLSDLGCVVRMICPQPVSAIRLPSIRVPGYESVQVAWVSRRELRERWQTKRPDAVYIGMESVIGCSALKVANDLGIITLAGFHTNFHQYARSWKLPFLAETAFKLMRWFHNRASATMVPSTSVKNELKAAGFQNLHVMGRGVDVSQFSPSKRCPKLRNKWGAYGDDPVAIFIARISPEKNMGLLAEVFKIMRELNPRVKCVVVGDGPSQEFFAEENPEVYCTKFLLGEGLAAAYASADILVFPSMTETFGNTVTEAMASGLVTVAYDYAAANMHIEDNVSGLLVPFGDHQCFLDRSIEALDHVCNTQMRNSAVSDVSNVSWEKVARTVVATIELSTK